MERHSDIAAGQASTTQWPVAQRNVPRAEWRGGPAGRHGARLHRPRCEGDRTGGRTR